MARTRTFSPEEQSRVEAAVRSLSIRYGSQAELARVLKVSPQSLSGLLAGRGVGLSIARGAASLLGIKLEDLLGSSPSLVPAPVSEETGWVFEGVEASFDSKRHTLSDAKTVLALLQGAPVSVHARERTYEATALVWLDTAAEYRKAGKPLTTMILLLESSGLEVLR